MWPVPAHPQRDVVGNGDALSTIAWLWERSHEVPFRFFGTTRIAGTGAPFGWVQGNGLNWQWLTTYWPAHLVTGAVGEVAAYNLVVLSGLALSGLAMYLFLRDLDVWPGIAAWGGVVFMVFPWHIARAETHGGLTHLWGFVLLLWVGARWRRAPGAGWGLAMAGAVGVLFLTSAYFGIMGLVMTGVLLATGGHVVQRSLGRPRAALAVVAAGGLSLAAAALVTGLVLAGRGSSGIVSRHTPRELLTYGARLEEFVVPPERGRLLGGVGGRILTGFEHGSNPAETALYVGLLTLLAAVVGIVIRRRPAAAAGSAYSLTFLAVAAAGVLCALPSPITVAGAEVPMPSRLIFAAVPEFRVVSRFVVLVMCGLIPLAALGLEYLRRRLVARGPVTRSRRIGVAVALVAAAVSAAELATTPPITHVQAATAPDRYAGLALRPPGPIAEYPLRDPDDPGIGAQMMWRRVHGRAMLSGAPRGTWADWFRQTAADPYRATTPAILSALGIRTVVLDDDPGGLPAGFQLVHRARSGGGAVLAVTATPGAAAAWGEGFGDREPAGDGTVFRWMREPTGRLLLMAAKAGDYELRFTAGSFQRPRVMTLTGAAAARRRVAVAAPAQVRVTVRVPAGPSVLTVRATPDPEIIPGDGRAVSVTLSDVTVVPAPAGASGVLPTAAVPMSATR